MRGDRSRTARDRGTTPALTYVLAIGIVTLLISGLLIATTDFVDGERERVVREELEIVGERLAADAMAVDRLAVEGANTTQRTTVPETVAGVAYYVDVVGCSSGNACLALTSADPSFDVNVTVPVDNRSAMTVTRAGTRTIRINVAPGTDPSPTADADRRVDSTIGIARDVSPGLESSGALFEADTAPVVSGIRYSPAPPALDETVTFESDVTTFLDGNYTYRWEFGDGNVTTGNASTASTVTNTYSDPGRYNVSLQVTGPNGQSDTVSRLVRVSGLLVSVGATSTDVDGDGESAGFQVGLRNNFANESVTITDVEIDPADSSVRELDNPDSGEPEIEIGIVKSYKGGSITLYEDGRLVELEQPSDPIAERGDPGDATTLTVGEFYDGGGSQINTSGKTFEVAVRYNTSNKENYVSRFNLTPDSVTGTPTPTPSPGSQSPQIEDTDAECFALFDTLRVEITASDPNGDDTLDDVEIRYLDDDGDEISRSTEEFGADNTVEAYQFFSTASTIEVTVHDETGRSTSVSRSVPRCT